MTHESMIGPFNCLSTITVCIGIMSSVILTSVLVFILAYCCVIIVLWLAIAVVWIWLMNHDQRPLVSIRFLGCISVLIFSLWMLEVDYQYYKRYDDWWKTLIFIIIKKEKGLKCQKKRKVMGTQHKTRLTCSFVTQIFDMLIQLF